LIQLTVANSVRSSRRRHRGRNDFLVGRVARRRKPVGWNGIVSAPNLRL
jgi:hypothetical protein